MFWPWSVAALAAEAVFVLDRSALLHISFLTALYYGVTASHASLIALHRRRFWAHGALFTLVCACLFIALPAWLLEQVERAVLGVSGLLYFMVEGIQVVGVGMWVSRKLTAVIHAAEDGDDDRSGVRKGSHVKWAAPLLKAAILLVSIGLIVLGLRMVALAPQLQHEPLYWPILGAVGVLCVAIVGATIRHECGVVSDGALCAYVACHSLHAAVTGNMSLVPVTTNNSLHILRDIRNAVAVGGAARSILPHALAFLPGRSGLVSLILSVLAVLRRSPHVRWSAWSALTSHGVVWQAEVCLTAAFIASVCFSLGHDWNNNYDNDSNDNEERGEKAVPVAVRRFRQRAIGMVALVLTSASLLLRFVHEDDLLGLDTHTFMHVGKGLECFAAVVAYGFMLADEQ